MSALFPILEIVAVLLSPLFAVQVTNSLNKSSEARKRKLAVFHTLMMTREAWASQEHVRALNSIDIEFHGDRKARKVLEAWRAYLNHLNAPMSTTEAEAAVWNNTRIDRFVAVLTEMAKYFDYEFDETFIRSTSYTPRLHGDLEAQAMELRALLLEVLRGERALPTSPVNMIAPGFAPGKLRDASPRAAELGGQQPKQLGDGK